MFTISGWNLTPLQENLFSGDSPSRLVIGMVDNEAFNGSYATNPFNFKHYNRSIMKIYIDGQQQFTV